MDVGRFSDLLQAYRSRGLLAIRLITKLAVQLGCRRRLARILLQVRVDLFEDFSLSAGHQRQAGLTELYLA